MMVKSEKEISVLFLDDDLPTLSGVISCLENAGFAIVTMKTLSEAIRYLKSDDAANLKLLVIDFSLPYGKSRQSDREEDVFTDTKTNDGRYTGAALLKEIRNNSQPFKVSRDIPAVFYTNFRADIRAVEYSKALNADICHKLSEGSSGLIKKINSALEEKKDE